MQENRQLNEYQRTAVLDESRACVVNASVGSGKTTVLIEKIRYLHEEKGVPFEQMMVLTFTNKAAGEIRERLGDSVCAEMRQYPYFGTFHSVAAALLRTRLDLSATGCTAEFAVMEPEEELALAMELIQREKLKIKYKNRLAKRLETEKEPRYQDDLEQLRVLLRAEKKKQNKMTFSDLMNDTVALLREQPVKVQWVIVDEVQDSDQKQLEFIRLLMQQGARLFAVGDPNQEIYSWRGNVFHVFYVLREEFHAKELTLPVNYRSSATILSAARYFQQWGSGLQGVRGEGKKVRCKRQYDSFGEANYLADRIRELHDTGLSYGAIAVFYRLQSQSRSLEQVFEREKIPFQAVVKKEHRQEKQQEDRWQEELQQEIRAKEDADTVKLMTLHASKGLEFSHVFIIGVNNGLIPMGTGRSGDAEEERRLLFVGMTRAENELELSYYTSPDTPGTLPGPSRFLRMIPPQYMEWVEEENGKVSLQELKRQIVAERRCSDAAGGAEGDWKTAAPDVVPGSSHAASGVTGQREQKDAMQKDAMQEDEIRDNHLAEQGAKYAEQGISGSACADSARRKVKHAKYGMGVVTAEDDMMITVEFEGYGEKEFIKAFSELET